MPKTIRDITDSNLEKDSDILIVFGMNISDVTGHQMAVQIPSSSDVCCYITWENRTNATWDKKRKTSVNLIIPDMQTLTALITVHSTVFAVLCSSKFMGCCLKISINSKSDWLKSKAEHYQNCYQCIKNASPCLCLHKWLIIQIFTVSSCTTGKLDKLSNKVLESWTKSAKCVLF